MCNLCNGAVQFVIKRDKEKYFQFSSLQSDFAKRFLKEKGIEANQLESIILFEDGKVFKRTDAALRISRHFSPAWKLCNIFYIIPRFIRDAVYNFIAQHRYKWFGVRDQCMVPTPELKYRFLE